MINQVYNIIEDSIYFLDKDGFRFYFSSDFNRERFKKLVSNYIKEENRKLINRYNVKIDLTNYMLISLYKKIEKRGFRVYLIEDNTKLLENVTFHSTI